VTLCNVCADLKIVRMRTSSSLESWNVSGVEIQHLETSKHLYASCVKYVMI